MLLLAILAACGGGADDSARPEGPTWSDDVAPIVATHCARCHSEGGPAPFSLADYASASAMAATSLAKMEGDAEPPYLMPPWTALDTEECAPPLPWKHDERLSEEELATFRAWVDAGTPEGEPREFPAVETAAFEGEPLSPARPLAVPADGPDLYRCIPLDPGLESTRWIAGLQVVPGDEAVVHHALVFSDPSGAARDLAGEDGSYDCYGGAGVPDAEVLFAWAPGSEALQMPEDAGFPLPAGGGLVLQLHHHPSGEATEDLTRLDVAWLDEAPAHTALMAAIGVASEGDADDEALVDPPFLVPAGAREHVETLRYPIELSPALDLRVWSAFGHMHLAGTDVRVALERDGEQTCLIQEPVWDFDWQRTYVYDGAFDELPAVRDGDVLEIRCTYDNTADNPLLAAALAEQGLAEPADIGPGEGTFDEMCVAILGVVY